MTRNIDRQPKSLSRKTALITGAHGFIGFHLAKKLLSENINLILVDMLMENELDSEFRELLCNPNVSFFSLNLSQEESCKLLPNVDFVFHLAALNGTQNFYSNPLKVLRHSSIPTLNLLERFHSVEKFFYAGSSESYAGGMNLGLLDIPTDEKIPLIIDDIRNPRWSYACAKTFGEIACTSAAKQNGTNVLIGRLHNIYGPRMGFNHVIPDFIRRALNHEYLLFGAQNTRSFLYVSDAVEDIWNLMKSPTIPDVYNVGGGDEITMFNLAQKILILMGRSQITITQSASPEGSVIRRVPDVGKINALLGNRNRTSLDVGLKSTLDWYTTHLGKL